MIKTQLQDGSGSGEQAWVKDNALVVTQYGCPPLIPQKNKIFRQYLTTNGEPDGTFDMRVDGSSTPIEFYVPAHPDNDRYISAVSFEIADGGAALNEFGAITALTNGCDFEYIRTSEIVVIQSGLKTNWNFIRMCRGFPAFGDAASAFRANNVSGSSEGFIPVFDFVSLLPPYGLKLDRGSSQKLILRVNDDVEGVDAFDAIAFGFERFE